MENGNQRTIGFRLICRQKLHNRVHEFALSNRIIRCASFRNMQRLASLVLGLLVLSCCAPSHGKNEAKSVTMSEGIATAMMYDEETDRIYVTGKRDNDCWLGVLQLPVHGGNAKWIKNINLGMEDQTESCTAIGTCRTGNSRQLFVTGISFGGSSLLRTGVVDAFSSNSTTEQAERYQRTSGWLWDISWYGEVKVRAAQAR